MKEKTYSFIIDGVTITVTKKRMKNMYLRIKKEDGSVLISAPHQASKARIQAFAAERIDWIKANQQKFREMNLKRSERPPLTESEIKSRKALLKTVVEGLVAKWEPVIGVEVSGITIRQMKTRWGSCNVKTRHININLALCEKDPECLEYVVIHEMCHILEASHNAVFWNHVANYCPDWKNIKKRLSEESVN